MQTGSSGTLIGWKSGQTPFFPLWDRMEGAWLWTLCCTRAVLAGGALTAEFVMISAETAALPSSMGLYLRLE
jgi:hypothetical protein